MDVRVLGAGQYVRLVCRDGWEYVERVNVNGVVAILAITDDDKVVLTEQFRKPLDRRVIDLPAGLAGDGHGQEDEDLVTAAQRELVEETGYKAQDMLYLTHGPSSAGLTDEVITFFRATGLRKVGPGGGDKSEDIVVHEVPLVGIDEWLKRIADRGVSIDPKIYAALYFAVRAG